MKSYPAAGYLVFAAFVFGVGAGMLHATPRVPTSVVAPIQQMPAADQFLTALAKHCGGAYPGQIVSNGEGFGGRVLIMQITDCTDAEIHMPFEVADDRAHALVLKRTANGLQLRHAHARADGIPVNLSDYGGESINGSASRQEFHVDPHSISKLQREGIDHAAGNVWALEIVDDATLRYELQRADLGPLVIEFDLANPVPLQESVIAYSARMKGGELIATAIIE